MQIALLALCPLFSTGTFVTQSNLKPWRAVTMSFTESAGKGVQYVSLFVPVPPNTSTQKNSQQQAVFKANGAKGALADDTVKSHTIEFNSSDGKQSIMHYVWVKAKDPKDDPSANALANGFTCQVNFYAELYYQSVTQGNGAPSRGSVPPAHWAANPNDPVIQNFFSGAQGRTVLETVGNMIYRIGGKPYGSSHSASETAMSGGDCGGKSNLFAAGCRIFGIPARVDTGWAIYETGKIEPHCRPEYMDGGSWIFAEPTWYRRGMTLDAVLGVNGVKAPHLFTMHRGMYLSHGGPGDGTDPNDKDPNGNLVGKLGEKNNLMSLQSPVMFVGYQDGTRRQFSFASDPSMQW